MAGTTGSQHLNIHHQYKKSIIMNKKLNIMATIKDGLSIALINFLSLILVTVLYLITIWIPYLNVGTTIAMSSLTI